MLVDGLIAYKVLSGNGEWIDVPEDSKYPKECFIKSSIVDRRLMDNRLYNWPLPEGNLMDGLVMRPQQIELK